MGQSFAEGNLELFGGSDLCSFSQSADCESPHTRTVSTHQGRRVAAGDGGEGVRVGLAAPPGAVVGAHGLLPQLAGLLVQLLLWVRLLGGWLVRWFWFV